LVKNKTRIYLSLDGVYNQINLNTLLDEQGKYLVDSKNLTIVSNTKDLLALKSKKPQRKQANTASLFGYPRYFIGKDRIREKASNQNRQVDFSLLDERDATGINELPGTRTEVAQVKSILTSRQWDAVDFTDENASEKALKSIGYPNVLHIATHGFFVDENEASATFKLGTATEYARQNPLLRSGILLSGASNFIQNNFRLDNENGILTAYEASNLNLDNTDLVVLSACETGKGEVQNGEGVYGLQRAFQTAGAQAIIMSLWKVDDTATQELMTTFYQSWTNGSSKAEAFRKAQQEIKNKYNYPYYWGAFVMIGE
jgi:CHAT domain-containing protein